tara:strand:- start:976 stop:1509 length:534 start_codon:yes stop_codon:yes gene_type:complete
MAGFNEFNERPGLEGNTAAQPRVFGHDAIATTPYWNFTIKQGGSGYDASDVGDTLTGVGNVGVSGNITAVTGTAVTGFTFTSKGDAKVGETVILSAAISGGDGFQVVISADSLSNLTAESRGAMIYNNSTAAQDIGITTEAGTSVVFKGVPATEYVGYTHPILAIELTSGTDILAVY